LKLNVTRALALLLVNPVVEMVVCAFVTTADNNSKDVNKDKTNLEKLLFLKVKFGCIDTVFVIRTLLIKIL
jgi:hypothetical protein